MVALIMPGLAGWVVPQDVNRTAPLSNFGKRAGEFGILSVPGDLLKWAVECCLSYRRDDLVELVFQLDAASTLYRIALPEGLFFPVIANNGHAITLFTPFMVRQIRAQRKRRRADMVARCARCLTESDMPRTPRPKLPKPRPCDRCGASIAPFGYAPPPALMRPKRAIWTCADPTCRQWADDRRTAAIERFDPFSRARLRDRPATLFAFKQSC